MSKVLYSVYRDTFVVTRAMLGLNRDSKAITVECIQNYLMSDRDILQTNCVGSFRSKDSADKRYVRQSVWTNKCVDETIERYAIAVSYILTEEYDNEGFLTGYEMNDFKAKEIML